MTAPDEELFAVVREPSPPDFPTRIRFELPTDPASEPRGPGRPTTRGPHDARAPRYWQDEAERIVLELASRRDITSDDLHERYPHNPSATGAAIGALFRRLAREDKLYLVGYRPSTRPQARGRVVGIWRAT